MDEYRQCKYLIVKYDHLYRFYTIKLFIGNNELFSKRNTMKNRRIFLITGCIIVFIDLIIKIVMHYLVPLEQFINIGGSNNYIYSTTNNILLSSQQVSLLDQSNIPINSILIMSITFFVLGMYILYIKNKKIRKFIKVMIGGLILICGIVVFTVFQKYLDNIVIPLYIFNLVRSFGPLLVLFAFYSITNDKFLKFILVGFFSAGIGNTLNFFYPPFSIIDYIYIDVLNRILNSGIMNFADIVIYICQLLLIIFILIYLPIKKLSKKDKLLKKR